MTACYTGMDVQELTNRHELSTSGSKAAFKCAESFTKFCIN